ncbi:MAG: hypothetical protein M1820_001583 [Bogoriella megaspora]|nr:MAG: hypothetical protein M1820_001583 [Bogoriella megaspora]
MDAGRIPRAGTMPSGTLTATIFEKAEASRRDQLTVKRASLPNDPNKTESRQKSFTYNNVRCRVDPELWVFVSPQVPYEWLHGSKEVTARQGQGKAAAGHERVLLLAW